MTFSPNNFQPRGKEKKAQEEEKSAMEEEELYRINVLYISGIQLHL